MEQQTTKILTCDRRSFIRGFGLAFLGIAAVSCAPKVDPGEGRILKGKKSDELLNWVDGIMTGDNDYLSFTYEGWNPPQLVLVPQTGEVNKAAIDIAFLVQSAYFLENLGGYQTDEIDISFSRPEAHTIIFVNRTSNAPRLMVESGEITITTIDPQTEQRRIVSVINHAGPVKKAGIPFSYAWSSFQALCLGYSSGDEDSDPECNVLAANAAAGWTMTRQQAKAWFGDGKKTTNLGGYTAAEDIHYVFLEDVYTYFLQLPRE